jgi:glucokinase
VAGPVRANKAQITNVNWSLDAMEMSRVLRIPQVKLINDFVGVGFGLLALERNDVVAINDTPAIAEAPKCCIGAGTGLGEAFLTWNGTEYDVWASEGGHADFAPRDEVEFKLLEFLKKTER